MRYQILSSCAAFALAACGTSDLPGSGSSTGRGTLDTASATETFDTIGQIVSAVNGDDPDSAASDVFALLAASETVVTPSSASARPAPPNIPTFRTGATGRPADTTGTATCDATTNTCTYVGYGDTEDDVSYTLDGTITTTATMLTVDLTMKITTSDSYFTWTVRGSVTSTPTLLSGELDYYGEADTSGEYGDDVKWEIDIGYDSIDFDDNGCAYSGVFTDDEYITTDSSGDHAWMCRDSIIGCYEGDYSCIGN